MAQQKITVRQAGLRWLEDCGHLRSATLEGYASIVRLLGRHFGADAPIRSLTPAALQRFFAGERSRVAPATYAHERRVTRIFTSWARRQGMLPLDGMAEVRSVRVPTSPPRILEETEEALLLREAAPALRGFIILAVETGLRRRALLSLKWEHVDLVSGRLDLPGDLLKSGRRLRVPLSQRAWDTLLSIRAESQETLVFPVPASTLGDWWRAAVRVTGLKGLRIHDLRKTFLTRCRRKGVALEVGMTLSDHHDVKTALRVYRQVDDADLLRAVDRVPCERDAKVEVVNGL